MSPCPSERELQDLLAEQLSPAQEQDLLSHVDVCRACQQALEELTAGHGPAGPQPPTNQEGPFWRRLKALVPGWPSTVFPSRSGPWRQETRAAPLTPRGRQPDPCP
jgi:hypothetical protein